MLFVLFCKQKTAYEMRISDGSADVCSSDLRIPWPEWLGLRDAVRPRITPVLPAQCQTDADVQGSAARDRRATAGQASLPNNPPAVRQDRRALVSCRCCKVFSYANLDARPEDRESIG